MASVARYVLLANLVSRTVDPVLGVTAVVAEDIRVDLLGGG